MGANDKRHNLNANQVDTVVLKISGVDKTSALSATTGTNTGDDAVNATSNAYADGKVANDLTTSTTVAPSKSAVNSALTDKADLVAGKVPAAQLPSYVDDIEEYADLASFPVTGETGKIYVAIDTNLTYRWTGSVYAALDPSLALGETNSTAYRGDRGKTAYDHSQLTTGNPHNVTPTQISGFDAAALSAAPAETLTTGGALITSGTDKSTPVDADEFAIRNSFGGLLAKVTWANIKATLKTYFDSLTTTFTNKRITPRYSEEASNVAPNILVDDVDDHIILAQAGDMTGDGITWTGTPTRNQRLGISITPTGGVRQLIFDTAKFEESYSQLFPTETFAAGVRMDIGCKFNNASGKFRVLSVS